MLPLCKSAAVVIVTMVCLAAPARALELWACSDMYRVNPVSGAITEKGNAPDPEFKKQNEVWDAKTRVVTVQGARNETVAFQVILEGKGTNLEVAVEAFAGPSPIPAEKVATFLVWNESADAMIPSYVYGLMPFSLPLADARIPALAGQTLQSIWVDVRIPADAKPGAYKSLISITSAGATVASCIVKLQVLGFALPVQPTQLTLLQWNGPEYMRPFGSFDDYKWTRGEFAIEMNMTRLLWAHRCVSYVVPFDAATGQPFAGCASGRSGPNVSVNADPWSWWDGRYRDLLSGNTWDFDVLPLYAVPVSAASSLAKGDAGKGKQASAASVEDALKGFLNHVRELGWKKSQYTLVNHLGADGQLVPWSAAKPVPAAVQEQALQLAEQAARLSKESDGIRLSYHMVSDQYCKQGNAALDRMKDLASVWFLPLESVRDAACDPELKKGVARGHQIWTTGRVPVTKAPSTAIAEAPWQAWSRGLKGHAYLDCGQPGDLSPNGAGAIVYGGQQVAFAGVIASARLQHVRRIMQDLEYMALASKAGNVSREAVAADMAKAAEAGPAALHAARLKLAGQLAGKP